MVGEEERVDADRLRRASHLAKIGPAHGPALAEGAGADREHQS